MSIQDKMIERFKVRVVKGRDDDRRTLCGENMQVDKATGEHFFIIPGHQAEYINATFPTYKVSEPFIPGVDLESALNYQEKPIADEEDEGKK